MDSAANLPFQRERKARYLVGTPKSWLRAHKATPALLWKWHIRLTQAEAAFRTARSDPGLRPVFHRKENCVQAHIPVCFLELALWRTLD